MSPFAVSVSAVEKSFSFLLFWIWRQYRSVYLRTGLRTQCIITITGTERGRFHNGTINNNGNGTERTERSGQKA